MNTSNMNCATLLLYVPKSNQELIEIYKLHVQKHNQSISNDEYCNSGFDMFVPEEVKFETLYKTQFINMQVKAEMLYDNKPSAFLMHPRSSISKTPLMLANSTGIIDSGYRGDLIGAFRSFECPYTVEKNTRLLQICHPSLCPIKVYIVHDEMLLSTTARGSGGFGSTGIVGTFTA
jgi:dUTP pyrophosphatase